MNRSKAKIRNGCDDDYTLEECVMSKNLNYLVEIVLDSYRQEPGIIKLKPQNTIDHKLVIKMSRTLRCNTKTATEWSKHGAGSRTGRVLVLYDIK